MKKSNILLSSGLAIGMAVTALPAYAVTKEISKNTAGQVITIYSNGQGSGVNTFFTNSSDFPKGTLNKPKKLLRVEYTVAAYPQATSDTVELCYYEPYQSNPKKCIPVISGSSDSKPDFNAYRFDNGAELLIRHKVKGPQGNVHPSQRESVTWVYSY